MTSIKSLPPYFRKLPAEKRRDLLQSVFNLKAEEIDVISGRVNLTDLSDVLIETAIGTHPIPLGLATGFLINGEDMIVPMATEEPSVIAAASLAALIIRSGGGFQAWADDPVMTAQVFLSDVKSHAEENILRSEENISQAANRIIPKMVKRGGGFKGLRVEKLQDPKMLTISLDIGVSDAMGANTANTVAEELQPLFQELSGGEVILAILTNECPRRKAGARFTIPLKSLHKDGLAGEEIGKKLVLATQIADNYPARAITHNKGVMNGISALALATGNDTRAIEAAAHFHAQKKGSYRSLTQYTFDEKNLYGSIELPLPLATVGGAIDMLPSAQLCLKLMNNPGAQKLAMIGASLGLAQNLAALIALVTEGIQSGHMRLHAAKIAYAAGARGEEIRTLAAKLWKTNIMDIQGAKKLLGEMRCT